MLPLMRFPHPLTSAAAAAATAGRRWPLLQVIPLDGRGVLQEAFSMRLEELKVVDLAFLGGCGEGMQGGGWKRQAARWA